MKPDSKDKLYFGNFLHIHNDRAIDPFPKRHRLAHNGGFLKFEALYCSLIMVSSTEIP